MHEEAHDNIYKMLKHHFEDGTYDLPADPHHTIMCLCVKNLRAGKGLHLTPKAFRLCKKHEYYKFYKVDSPQKFDSRYITILDNLSKTPFYVSRYHIYISDENVIFDLSMCDDDFFELMQLHK